MHKVSKVLSVFEPVADEGTKGPAYVKEIHGPEWRPKARQEEVGKRHIHVVEIYRTTPEVPVAKHNKYYRHRTTNSDYDQEHVGHEEKRRYQVLHVSGRHGGDS